MKIAYFDCSSGISGDMVLGAFIDLGLPLKKLKTELAKLNPGSFDLKVKKVKCGHIKATKVDVVNGSKKRFNDLKSMIRFVDKSKLDRCSKEKIRLILTTLAKAEAKVHKQSLDKVHFHQLGELDTIIDIAGCVLAAKLLGIEQMFAGSLVSGSGTIKFGKHVFPLPAPAAAELLKKRTLRIDPDIKHETVTPTGAVLVACMTKEIKHMPHIQIENIGYGAGSYRSDNLPGSLRIITGTSADKDIGHQDRVFVVETNIDDTLGLNFDMLFERLFLVGALDVFTCAVMMKKQRPGVLLQIQTEENNLEPVINTVFEETSTIGLRINQVIRRRLNRKILKLKTDYGIIVRVKIAYSQGRIMNIAPEYEDCKAISKKKSLPFKSVFEKIKAQAIKKFG
jgi:uncharacterized protein (TIGR00299 family) protein